MITFKKKHLDEFDYLGNKAYMDVACVAMQPKRTLTCCREFQDQFVKSNGEICFTSYSTIRDVVRTTIANLLGCSEENILFTPNTTAGDCLLMTGLTFQNGDNVVVSNFDFSSVNLGWYKLQEKGLKVKTVTAENGCITADSLIRAIDRQTRVVAVSHVHNLSGYRVDIEKLGNVCRERDIYLSVDGIQAAGRIPIDVVKAQVDIYSCGGFKGLLGVLGSAFTYCSDRVLETIQPVVWSDSNLDIDDEMPETAQLTSLSYRPKIARLEGGSNNTYGIAAMGTSIDLLLEIGVENIHSHIIELEREFRSILEKESLPIHIWGADEITHWSGIISFSFDKKYLDKLKCHLAQTQIFVTLDEKKDEGYLRISLHYYNKREHIERLARILKEVFADNV